MYWHQLHQLQDICTLLKTDNNVKTPALNFYGPGSFLMPSRHYQSTEGHFFVSVCPYVIKLRVDWLIDCKEYMASCRPREGVDSIPGGTEFYQQCLKWHTSLDITPAEVHEIGWAEVARIRKEMERVEFVHTVLQSVISSVTDLFWCISLYRLEVAVSTRLCCCSLHRTALALHFVLVINNFQLFCRFVMQLSDMLIC